MNIFERTKDLEQRVNLVAAAKTTYNEAKQLDDFRVAQLETRVPRAQDLLLSRSLLTKRQIGETWKVAPSTLVEQVGTLRERFAAAPKRSTLVAASGWPLVQPGLDAYLKATEKFATESWSTFCGQQAPSIEPAAVRADAAINVHVENQSRLQEYDRLYRQLARSSSVLPRLDESIDDFLATAERAREVLKSLKRQMPRKPRGDEPPIAVQRFLADIDNGGVELSALTEDITHWLSEQGRIGEFEVRRKGS